MSSMSLRGAISLALAATVSAGTIQAREAAPSKPGYTIQWQDNFEGAEGTLPNQDTWWLGSKDHYNEEWQDYQADTKNVQLSGSGSLQLIPWREGGSCQTLGENGNPVRTHECWSSGRVESNYQFTPAAGSKTIVEARIRFGDNPTQNMQGFWPAFWLLGAACNEGVEHPTCGETDIMERVNGNSYPEGTLWCQDGDCGQSNGVDLGDNDWHTWAVTYDRTAEAWQDQTITWSLDGYNFLHVSGGLINRQSSWEYVAAKRQYIIFNVAVGGEWPGDPNAETLDGYGAKMEVAYVAHYQSN